MAAEEDVQRVFTMFQQRRPFEGAERLDSTHRGMGSILQYLTQKGEPVSAGELSEQLGVSTARVAVLLQKMSAKGFIVTGSDPSDARRTLVSISESGQKLVHDRTELGYAFISAVIDKIGIERTEEFLRTSQEIHAIFHETINRYKS